MSSLVQTPSVVGWLRPIVLMPVGVLAGLPSEQVEALLLHELAHIRRYDYLINVLQSVIESLLFYHPAVWWLYPVTFAPSVNFVADDIVVSVSGDALTYVRALAELEFAGPSHFRTAVAASGGLLAHRIARLLGLPRPASGTLSGSGNSPPPQCSWPSPHFLHSVNPIRDPNLKSPQSSLRQNKDS